MCMCRSRSLHSATLPYSTVNTAQVGGYTVLGMLEEGARGVTEGTQWYGGSRVCLAEIVLPRCPISN